jgi:hypothetical protein
MCFEHRMWLACRCRGRVDGCGSFVSSDSLLTARVAWELGEVVVIVEGEGQHADETGNCHEGMNSCQWIWRDPKLHIYTPYIKIWLSFVLYTTGSVVMYVSTWLLAQILVTWSSFNRSILFWLDRDGLVSSDFRRLACKHVRAAVRYHPMETCRSELRLV